MVKWPHCHAECIQRWQCYNRTWQSIPIYNCCREKRVFVIVQGCVILTQCEGWLCLVTLEGCSKFCGKGNATSPCIILNSIITLASALLCSSVLSPSWFCICVTLEYEEYAFCVLIARRWTILSLFTSFFVYGLQTVLAYSTWGRTMVL